MDKISAKAYIDHLTAKGRISFTVREMAEDLGLTPKAVERAISRLRKRREIASPAKGYYLILTPEFRQLGCLPPDYFIDDLMKYWRQPYYVGLLSAGLYLGAAHQQLQVFQIITDRYRRSLYCGRVKIQFIIKKKFKETHFADLKTHSGYMKISTAEATMMDLIRYMRASGGINRVTTVLAELAEIVQPTALRNFLLKMDELILIQRLGFLLEYLGHYQLAEIMAEHLRNKKIRVVSLVSYASMKGAERNMKWRIAINAHIEDDINDTN